MAKDERCIASPLETAQGDPDRRCRLLKSVAKSEEPFRCRIAPSYTELARRW